MQDMGCMLLLPLLCLWRRQHAWRRSALPLMLLLVALLLLHLLQHLCVPVHLLLPHPCSLLLLRVQSLILGH
jgi:hypothetical protein